MPQLNELTGPGFFSVKSQPKKGCGKEYNEWYNSEHGPLRLKLDFVLNGYRYKSIDQETPTYLATYDIKRISGFDEPQYKNLTDNRSPREQEILDHKLDLFDRRIYVPVSPTRGHFDGPAPIMLTVTFVIKDEHVAEMHRWYEEEHTSDLMQIPGWLRSRRFKLVEADYALPSGHTELLAVHEFAANNGLDGTEHEFAKSRPWRNRVVPLAASRMNQRFELLHEFKASDYRAPSASMSVAASGSHHHHKQHLPNGVQNASSAAEV